MPRVYITYRPNDTTADEVQQLVAQIGAAFGDENVHLTAADSHVDVLRLYDLVQSYDALLVVIGQRWLAMQNEQGERLIDDPFDYAYTEIFAALEKPDMWVSNLLTDGAKMPQWGDLPEAVKHLARRDSVDLSNKQRLTEKINELIRRMGAIDVHVPEDIVEEPPQPLPVRRSPRPQPQFEEPIRASNETQQVVGCVSNFVMAIFMLVGLTAILVVVFGLLFSDSGTSDSVSVNAARLTHRAPATFEMQTLSGWNRTQVAATVNSGRRTAQVRSQEINRQEGGETATHIAQEFNETIATLTVVIDATRTSLAEMRTHVVETEAGYVAVVTEMAQTRTARLGDTRQNPTTVATPSPIVRESRWAAAATATAQAVGLVNTGTPPPASITQTATATLISVEPSSPDRVYLADFPPVSGRSRHTMQVNHQFMVQEQTPLEVIFHPTVDHQLIIAAESNIALYDIRADEIHVIKEWTIAGQVRDMAYSDDGQYLIVATNDNRLASLQDDGTIVYSERLGASINAITFVPDTQFIMAYPDSAAPIFWTATTLEEVESADSGIYHLPVDAFAVHPSQTVTATGYSDGAIIVGNQLIEPRRFSQFEVRHLEFSRDGQRLVSARNKVIQVWETDDLHEHAAVLTSADIIQVNWLPYQFEDVIAVTLPLAVYLIDADSLSIHDVYSVENIQPLRVIHAVAVSANGRWLAVSESNGGITLLSLNSN